MCFPRKSSLGHYNADKKQWKAAYRQARILLKGGATPNAALSGVEWKAQLIISGERDRIDWLSLGARVRLDCIRLTDELLAELA